MRSGRKADRYIPFWVRWKGKNVLFAAFDAQCGGWNEDTNWWRRSMNWYGTSKVIPSRGKGEKAPPKKRNLGTIYNFLVVWRPHLPQHILLLSDFSFSKAPLFLPVISDLDLFFHTYNNPNFQALTFWPFFNFISCWIKLLIYHLTWPH